MTKVQRLLLSSTALGGAIILAATPAFSQTSAPTGQAAAEADVDELVIVGSRIRRDTFNSASPVQVLTREESTMAGFSSTTDVLQSTAVTGGGAQINNAFGGFVTQGGPGANTVGLRGLGAARTLILINGRRLSPAGTRGAVGSVDLNVLPTSIIDRIDILRDGRSAVYGSDAIAGVIDIVTQQDIDGITFEAQVDHPTEGDGDEYRFSVVAGKRSDSWRISGSFDYYERTNLRLRDRDWTRCNTDMYRNPTTGQTLDFIDPLTGQPKCYPITTTGSNGVTINTIGTSNITAANAAALGLMGPVVGAPGSSGTTFNRFRPNSAVTTGLIGFEGVGGGSNNLNVRDTFDPRTLNRDLISPAKVYTAYLQGAYELQALGNAEAYFEALATRRLSRQTGYRQFSMDYRKGSPLIPANLQFSTFAPDQGTSGGQQVGVRAFVGFGNDQSTQEVDFFKFTTGLKGDFGFLSDWKYDATVTHSESDAEYTQQSFLTDRVTRASDVVAAPAGTDASLVRNGLTCRINLTNPGERCIPFPPLNSATIGGQLPQDFRDYVFRPVAGNTQFEQTDFTFYLDGPIWTLPAGEVNVALGVEYRRQKIHDQPDPNSISGNLYNLTSSAVTKGSDNVKEAYAEVDVPLLRDLPMVRDLTVTGAFRWTDYKSYGDDTTYQLNARWGLNEWLSLRAGYGTSFRAPALFEQFQGATSGFLSNTLDPCNNYGVNPNPARRANCAAELPGRPDFQANTSVRVLSQGGAAAGLEAETSKNFTAGVIFEPPLGDAFGDLSISIDYFDIKIDNGVGQAGAANILPFCYDEPGFRAAGGFCRLVTRDPATNALTVSNAFTNIATQVVNGYDFDFRYEREIGPGRFRINGHFTRFTSQADKLFETDSLTKRNGTINFPKLTGDVDFNYTVGGWRVRYGFEYIKGQDAYAFRGENPETSMFDLKTGDYFRHFVSVRYTDTDAGWQITAGVKNFTNEDPPTISSGFYNRVGNAPLYSGYDYVGRTAWMQLVKSF